MAQAQAGKSGRGPKPQRQNARSLKRKRNEEDLSSLNRRIDELDTSPTATSALKAFSELPLSDPTSSGLSASHFKTLTDIQARAIPNALKGRDILGAAKTGSGKTLAFLVPVLENLYRKQWSEYDGLGALILSPTRELAIQIFEVLRKIGRYHTFSAGLVIGGKSLQEEQERLGRMNILVCTPGRMLQHLDQTAVFDASNLQMLVLDEADRIMDMGFQSSVDAIIEHLPKDRQTMLFSATQTKKVSDLARLSLQDPEFVAVHEAASSATPAKLQQHYIISPLPEKLDTLWSFIRSSLKSKIMVFFSSSKQVRFVYEAFRHMQPGIPLLHLHGRQKQGARVEITRKFSTAKYSCLFATDIAARGLDFPAVDWVIQLDCPEDADTYIHRVGRTARYERDGRAVLFLEPSEEAGMLKRLEQKRITIEKINIRAKKQQSIKDQLQNMCFKDPQLKYLGQKAFTSYVKSIHIQKDKEVFDVKSLPLEEYAASLGLPGAPRIKFIRGEDTKARKNAPRHLVSISSDDEDSNSDADKEERKKKESTVRTKYDRMFERRNQDILTEHFAKLIHDEDAEVNIPNGDADEDDDFLSVKRRFDAGDDDLDASSGSESDDDATTKNVKAVQIDGKEPLIIDSKRREKLLKSKKKLLKFKGKGTRLVYDDEGNPHELYEMEDEDQFKAKGDADAQRLTFLELEAERTRLADIRDKEIAKQKKREKKEKKRARAKAEREAEAGSGAVLAPLDEEEHEDQPPSDEEAVERPIKKQKKWFQDSSDAENERRKPGKPKGPVEVNTLEELEALATGLLG
jgi:ATP-dependent RNA helicase DDX10/DBP4